jgi:Cu-Zn family superoxide dismutase
MKKLGVVVLALLLGGVWFSASDAQQSQKSGTAITKAVCVLHHTQGHKAHGTIWFTRRGGEIEITGEITGLKPGLHAFHVHEYGDCSAPDASSAGGHFNPEHKMHGNITARERHVGDLGNIMADGTGRAVINIQDREIRFSGPHSIIGRGLIVHEKPDDFKTQPTGNAGGRVACGVIGIAKP